MLVKCGGMLGEPVGKSLPECFGQLPVSRRLGALGQADVAGGSTRIRFNQLAIKGSGCIKVPLLPEGVGEPLTSGHILRRMLNDSLPAGLC